MVEDSLNPYTPTNETSPEQGIYGSSTRVSGGFLRRVVEGEQPIPFRLRYTGWWFVQRIFVNDRLCWWKISVLKIEDNVTFQLPKTVDKEESFVSVQIEFSPGLWIRRFQIWIREGLVYDEVC